MGFSRFLQMGTALGLGALSLCRADTTVVLDPNFSAEVVLYPISPDMTLEADKSPCSEHIFTVHKGGFITVYDDMSVAANLNPRRLADFQDETYSFWDHAFSGLKFHPEFPTVPYIYLLYSAEPKPPAKPWGDSCPESNIIDGVPMCNAYSRLVRLKLDVTMDPKVKGKCLDFAYKPKVAANTVILMEGWCSSSVTHSNGDLVFLPDGDLLLSVGDAAQYSIEDAGLPGTDVCFEPAKGFPQGSFKSQRLDFLQGKVLRVKADSLLSDGPLGPDDYSFAAIGLRNPYSMTRDPVSGDVYVGDVGSSLKEEINRILAQDLATGNVPNFGWPCIEGIENQMQLEWITNGCDPKTDDCTLCAALWPCIPGSADAADCDPNYRPPAYEYRGAYPPLDPRYPTNCASGSASISALTFYSGGEGSYMPHNLVAGDRSYGCQWFFDEGPDGKPDFASGARVLAAMAGVTSHQVIDGYLYSTSDFGVLRHEIGNGTRRLHETPSNNVRDAAAAADANRRTSGAADAADATGTASRGIARPPSAQGGIRGGEL